MAAAACALVACIELVAYLSGFPAGASWLSAVGAAAGLIIAGVGLLLAHDATRAGTRRRESD